MTLRLFGCVCGHLESSRAGMGLRGEGRMRSPMPFYVIEHEDGVALFDCGVHADLVDPNDDYNRRLAGFDLNVELSEAELTARSLEALDIDPARVRYMVASHLHFDHSGGLHQLPNATVVVQRREWQAGQDRDAAARYALPRRFFDLGHEVMQVDGEHDLFGDGSVVCVPSYGHTPGHQSLRVRSDQGDHLLVGDACYNCEAYEARSFPEFADAAAMNASLDALMASCAPETVVVWGHDPGQWGERPVLPATRG